MSASDILVCDGDIGAQMWQMKRLIRNLDEAKGNGTSMISIVVPRRGQIAKTSKLLTEELGTASNIKSHVNKLSVIEAIKSCKQKLSLYNRVPGNGLVMYCGRVVGSDGKERMINIDLEPFKPLMAGLYHCDNKFHTQCLKSITTDTETFGFIIIDGNGTLFATLSGNFQNVLQCFSVHLPKKHSRGGQSADRFARTRVAKRKTYLLKIAEIATKLFVTNDKCNVTGLILAGVADLKTELSKLQMFDPRLKEKILKIVDICYGGINGFNQAISLSAECLGNIKFLFERKLIGSYFDEIAQNSDRYCFGVNATIRALEMGAVETLIVFEELDIIRYVLKNHKNDEEIILYLKPADIENRNNFTDPETGVQLELVDKGLLVEWLVDSYKTFGATLELVTDRSPEGVQFVHGFGGIGGMLRYTVDFSALDNYDDLGEDFDLSDY